MEASLVRMEKMLSDNKDTVVAIQEAITRVEIMTAGKRHTSNSTNNEGERRWWRSPRQCFTMMYSKTESSGSKAISAPIKPVR